MTAAATAAPSIPEIREDRDRYTGEHAVAERLAHECEASQDDVGPDDGTGDRDEHARDESPHHERVVEEWIDERAHGSL